MWCAVASQRSQLDMCDNQSPSLLSVDLIKWSRVSETAVPNFIDDFGGMGLVLATRSRRDSDDSPSLHTILMMHDVSPLTLAKKLSGPSTFAAQ